MTLYCMMLLLHGFFYFYLERFLRQRIQVDIHHLAAVCEHLVRPAAQVKVSVVAHLVLVDELSHVEA